MSERLAHFFLLAVAVITRISPPNRKCLSDILLGDFLPLLLAELKKNIVSLICDILQSK